MQGWSTVRYDTRSLIPYLSSYCCQVDLSDPQVEPLEADVLLQLVGLVEQLRFKAPVGGNIDFELDIKDIVYAYAKRVHYMAEEMSLCSQKLNCSRIRRSNFAC